jgi:hypothetical protein
MRQGRSKPSLVVLAVRRHHGAILTPVDMFSPRGYGQAACRARLLSAFDATLGRAMSRRGTYWESKRALADLGLTAEGDGQ